MRLSFAVVFAIFICGCSVSKMRPDSKVKNVRFGNGGGFTGKEQSYNLNKKGEVFFSDSLVLKIKKGELKELYSQAGNLLEYEYSSPRNIYSFITIVTNSDTNYIVWGYEDINVSIKVKKLFKDLKKLVKTK